MVHISFVRALMLASAATVFASSALVAATTAQDAPPAGASTTVAPHSDANAVSPTDSATGEIVVTARRTEESLQRVPGSISAFSERTLDRLQATDTTGLQGAVPNLNIVQGRGSSNATNIYIRGIGQPDALQTFDPAVGVYVDDVYLSRIRGNQLDLLDVDRVEVLRGPQGTLYGKNTIGGALKFVSRRPGQQFRANASVGIGSYGEVDLKGSASGPVSSTLAAGFAVLRSTHDGYVKDPVLERRYNDKGSVGARASLAFTPSKSFRLDLTADYSRDDSRLNVGQPQNSLTYLFGGILLALPSNPANYDYTGRTTPSLPNSTRLRHWGVSANAAVDVTDALALKSITAFRKLKTDDYIDIDATQKQVGDVFVGVNQKQFSQEFQAALTAGRLTGVAGLYYLREDVGSHQEAYADDLIGPVLGNPTFLRTIDDQLTTKSYAAYANGSFEIIPAVRLSAGIRFTHETKDYDRTTSTFSNLALLRGTFGFTPPIGKWNDTSPMASVDWQVAPKAMLYARVAKGFKSGGFNGRANDAASATKYAPEKVISYEAGFKSTIADQLRLNGALFYNDYKDFQARVSGIDTDPITGIPAPKLSVLNAGKLRIKGAELEAAWTPVERLLIDAQVGYLDAKYKQFDDVRFTATGGSRAFQTPAFSPKWTLRFGAQYGLALSGAGELTIGGQTRYKSRTALAVDNTFTNSRTEIAGMFQDGYWVEDARIVYEPAGRHFSVGLYANNITKKVYKTDAQEFSSIGSIRTAYFGSPRTFTVRLTARY